MTTQRWTFYDPVALTSYTVPRNPNVMTNIPTVARNLRHAPAWGGDDRVVSYELPSDPLTFEFGGSIADEAHYNALLSWAQVDNEIIITDHLGRSFLVFITAFQPTEQQPTRRNPWRITYTMICTLLETGVQLVGVAQETDTAQS